MPLKLQREFFQLAAVWLTCRQKAMLCYENDAMFIFLGEMDYHMEMMLLIKESEKLSGVYTTFPGAHKTL